MGLEETAEPTGATLAWLAVTAIVASGILGPFRRVLVNGLALALVLLSFESSVHAVHHLGDTAAASECSVAGATAHLAGTVVEPASIDVRSCPIVFVQSLPPPSAAVRQPFRPDSGRAPPSA